MVVAICNVLHAYKYVACCSRGVTVFLFAMFGRMEFGAHWFTYPKSSISTAKNHSSKPIKLHAYTC